MPNVHFIQMSFVGLGCKKQLLPKFPHRCRHERPATRHDQGWRHQHEALRHANSGQWAQEPREHPGNLNFKLEVSGMSGGQNPYKLSWRKRCLKCVHRYVCPLETLHPENRWAVLTMNKFYGKWTCTIAPISGQLQCIETWVLSLIQVQTHWKKQVPNLWPCSI